VSSQKFRIPSINGKLIVANINGFSLRSPLFWDFTQRIWVVILRRTCFLQRVIEGKIKGGIEVTERRGRRRRKLLDDLKKSRGYSHLKEESLARTM
jgi:hypothetical protein